MNKLVYKLSVLFVLSIALLNTQCKNKEYDLSQGINTDMQIGGDSLMFPIGTTDTLRLSTFLNTADISMLTILADGSYALLMADSMNVVVPELNASDLTMADVVVEQFLNIPLALDGNSPPLPSPRFSTPLPPIPDITLAVEINDSNNIEIQKNDFPAEVYALDSMVLLGGKMEITVDLKNAPDLGNPFKINLRIDLPDNIRFGGNAPILPGNIIEFKQDLVNNKISLVLDIHSFILDGKPINGLFNFPAKLAYRGKIGVTLGPGIDVNQALGKIMNISIAAKLTNMQFSKVYGILNPQIPTQEVSVSLASLPAFLKGDNVVLDFASPHLDLIAQSNLGIPVGAEVDINPWIQGQISTPGVQKVSIKLPASPMPSQVGVTKYWIADTKDGMPNDYTFEQTPLSDLLKKVPDSIQFAINAKADITQQHQIDLGADYKAKLNYTFLVPIAFGSDFRLSLTDTISIPSTVGNLMQGNTIGVYGEVVNTLPIDLELQLIPIDSTFKHIPIKIPSQIIKAGTRTAGEVMTKLNIEIADPDKIMKSVYGFILQFGAKTGTDTQGITIKESNYVRARLKLRVLGGIQITL
ncbi:MAG: hypothetical protein RRY15_00480 [Bacteroidales bacterium]